MNNSSTFKLTVLLALTIATSDLFSQYSKKENINRYKTLVRLSLDEKKNQKHSEIAREITIENFIAYYLRNGKEKTSKMYGTEYIDSLYNDSAYTYYIHRTKTHALNFFRIKLNDIRNINISGIDGKLIREKFFTEIVLNEDKEKVKRRSRDCTTKTGNSYFVYLYDKNTRLIEVKYKWKETCDFIRVINKSYKSNYCIDSKTFKN